MASWRSARRLAVTAWMRADCAALGPGVEAAAGRQYSAAPCLLWPAARRVELEGTSAAAPAGLHLKFTSFLQGTAGAVATLQDPHADVSNAGSAEAQHGGLNRGGLAGSSGRGSERRRHLVVRSALAAAGRCPEALAALVESHHWEFDGRNACHAISALARDGCGLRLPKVRRKRLLALLSACLEHDAAKAVAGKGLPRGQQLSPRDVAAGVHGLVKLGGRGVDVPGALLEAASAAPDALSALDAFQLAWALGRGRLAGGAFVLGALEGRLVMLTAELPPWQVAMVLWSYAVLGQPAPALFAAGRAALLAAPPDALRTDTLLSALWAFAAADAPGSDLYDAALSPAVSRLPELSARHLGILLEAFTRAGHPGAATLLRAAAATSPVLAPRRADDGDDPFAGQPAALAQTLWALAIDTCARPGCNYSAPSTTTEGAVGNADLGNNGGPGLDREALFALLAPSLAAALSTLRPSDLSRALWAYAAAGGRSAARLLRSAEGAVVRARHTMRPGDVVRVAWAYAWSSQQGGAAADISPAAVAALAKALSVRAAELRAGEAAEAAWAFATLRHCDEQLFRALREPAAAGLAAPAALPPSSAAALLWAFAEAGGEATRGLMAAAAAKTPPRGMAPDELALSTWAVVAGGGRPGPAWTAALASAAPDFSRSALGRLMQAQLMLRATTSAGETSIAIVPPLLAGAAWQAWVGLVEAADDIAGKRGRLRQLQELQHALAAAGFGSRVERRTEGGLNRWALELWLPSYQGDNDTADDSGRRDNDSNNDDGVDGAGRWALVEVEPDESYSCGRPSQQLGGAAAHSLALGCCGWTPAIVVRSRDWEHVRTGDQGARNSYLAALVKHARTTVTRPPAVPDRVAGSVRLLNRMLEKHDKHRNVLHILLGGLLEAIDRHHDADADAVVGGNVDGFPHFLNLLAPYIVHFSSCLHARFFCGEISNLRIKSTALQTPCLLPVKYYGLELRRQVQLHSKPILRSSELMLEGSSIAALHGSLMAQCASSSCKRGCSGCSHGGVQIAAV